MKIPCDRYKLLWVGPDGRYRCAYSTFKLGNLHEKRLAICSSLRNIGKRRKTLQIRVSQLAIAAITAEPSSIRQSLEICLTASSGQCVSSGSSPRICRLRCEEWPPVRRCVRKRNGLGIRVVRCAILIVCFPIRAGYCGFIHTTLEELLQSELSMSMTGAAICSKDLHPQPYSCSLEFFTPIACWRGEAIQLQ